MGKTYDRMDIGPGDKNKYSAEYLEFLFKMGDPIPARIQGRVLNLLHGRKKFEETAWYEHRDGVLVKVANG